MVSFSGIQITHLGLDQNNSPNVRFWLKADSFDERWRFITQPLPASVAAIRNVGTVPRLKPLNLKPFRLYMGCRLAGYGDKRRVE
ncbi:MAG: hypothetical protein IID51_11260 [Proteobacteria bacterium]|nr:hypothetical protein [Pseudomonadota bacterium]